MNKLSIAVLVFIALLASTASVVLAKSQAEIAAWKNAETIGTPTAFKEFYLKYPHSPRIKTVTGTLRGRYWLKMNINIPGVATQNDGTQMQDGVIVTVEGMNVIMNISLEEAKSLAVIGCNPAPYGAKSTANGRTFHSIYFEAVDGNVIIGNNDQITPKDNLNSTIVLSADGTRLLTWDTSNATSAPQPSPIPTFIDNTDMQRFFK
jgi:hypothetical protein